ncbi:MAG: NmrA family NAD(P)-binding protein [Bacteroidetes bacterium]|nr:NmrA family NAD(P)-binding protein [Bacteroidota bacterium]
MRIIGRDASKAQSLIDQGAEFIQGSSTDRQTLVNAFHGAKAAYVLIPPNMTAPDFAAYQAEATENIGQAIQGSGIQNVFTLSSVGAHLTSGAGVVQGLPHMENRFNQIPGVNVLHLRPTYFLENTLGQAGAIKMMGAMGSPVRGDLKIPMIATQDIAHYATKRLQALDFQGKNVQHLFGAEDVSYDELAKVYGAKIGKPELTHMQLPYDAFKGMMVSQWGASESMADKMIEFTQAVNEGRITEIVHRDAESTTPTTVAEFANVFAHVYNS